MRTKEREIKSLISPSLIFPLLGTAFTYFFFLVNFYILPQASLLQGDFCLPLNYSMIFPISDTSLYFNFPFI